MFTPLHAKAADQGGVLFARDANELGWRWEDFHDVMEEEGWTRLFRGAYLHPEVEDGPESRARAVQLLRPGLVACFELAAFIHGYDMVGAPRLHFNATDKSRKDVPGGELSRWLLDPKDIVNVNGVLVTSPLSTAIGLLRRPNRDAAVMAVDSALRRGDVSLDEIADRLERHGGDVGIRNAWPAFHVLDPRSGSITESKVRLIMWDRKIYPRSQVKLIGGDGRTYYADFVADGVVVEPEGFGYHGKREEHQRDVVRFNALAVAARDNELDFVRVTYDDAFHRSQQTGDLIARTIAARKRRHMRRAW